MSTAPQWLVVGKVLAAFGVDGEVRVMPETDFPERFDRGAHLYLERDERELVIDASRLQKGHYILKLRDVDDRDQAMELTGQLVRVPGSELAPLAEGEYYLFQLVGLKVQTEDLVQLGTIRDVIQTGANDVYVVNGDRGEVLLPAIPDVIRQVDLDAGLMTVHLLPGLVDE